MGSAHHTRIESRRLPQVAGLGCAMRHSREEVKQKADLVLEWNNDEDGVLRQCEAMYSSGRIKPRMTPKREYGLSN